MPDRVAVLNRLAVQVEFSAAGLAGVPIDVELLYDDEVVDRRSFNPSRSRELLRKGPELNIVILKSDLGVTALSAGKAYEYSNHNAQ